MTFKRTGLWILSAVLFTAFVRPESFEKIPAANNTDTYTSEAEPPNKWALIFAIGDYPRSGGWGKISADNDVPLIYNTLLSQGFEEERILVVSDSAATYQGIINSIQSHLTDQVSEGDIVFVHFSSHGQQIFDDNGDEIDGYDEAIVPFDAHLRYRAGTYEGEKHLRDDELGDLFMQLRQKLGADGSLLTLVDACHSGTSTRGMVTARGTKTLMEPRDYKPKNVFNGAEPSFMGGNVVSDNENNSMAAMVVISGASADELNYETKDDNGNGVGSLSYTFSKVLSDVRNKMTYRELFDRIKIEMSKIVPNQTPQIEGDLDREVFGGGLIEQESYFIPKKWYDSTVFQIGAGSIQGFTENSTVKIYDFGIQDFARAEPLAKGVVINSTAIESDIEVSGEAELEGKDLKVVLDEQSYEGLTVKVQLALNRNKGLTQIITERLDSSGVAEVVESGADLVIEDTADTRGSGEANLVTAQDQVIYTGNFNSHSLESEISDFITEIKKYTKANFLRNLELEAPDLNVELQVIPFDYEVRGSKITITKEYTLDDFITESGNVELTEGRAFKLRIKNNGTKDAYFTVADFTPSGEALLVVPYGNRQPTDFIIEPGREIELSENLLQITPPYGNEVLKLFATEEPLDLRPVLDPISRGTRAGKGPFQLLMEEASSNTRSAPLGVPPAAAHIHTVTFKVVPDKD